MDRRSTGDFGRNSPITIAVMTLAVGGFVVVGLMIKQFGSRNID